MLKNILLALLLLGNPAGADDIPIDDNTITETTLETGEEDAIIEEQPVEDDEISEEEKNEIVSVVTAWLSQYTSESKVISIIGTLLDTGLISILVAFVIKYQKRKKKEKSQEQILKETKETIKIELEKEFNKLLNNQINVSNITNRQLDEAISLILKALVLSQDKGSKSKLALLDLISQKSNVTEITALIEEVKEVVKEELNAEEIVKEKVKGTYNPVD